MGLPLLRIDHAGQALTLRSVDSKPAWTDSILQMDDDLPRPKGDAADQLSKESLDRYSHGELAERIVLLEAEIERIKAHRDKVASHRAAAEAFFKPRSE